MQFVVIHPSGTAVGTADLIELLTVIIVSIVMVLLLRRHIQSISPPGEKSTTENPQARTFEDSPEDTGHLAVAPPPLSDDEISKVQSGQLIFRPYRNDGGVNRGVAVQRVRAPSHVIWSCLTDFEQYPRMVDDVCSVDVYQRCGNDIKVAVSIGYSIVRLTTGLHHVLSPEWQQLTWSLDADRPSSFRSNDGFWLVRADPHDERSSIVYYSIAVELHGWVPSWVNGFVAKQGLPRAVAWVKKEAEARTLQAARPVVATTIAPQSAKAMPASMPQCGRGPAENALLKAVMGCFGCMPQTSS